MNPVNLKSHAVIQKFPPGIPVHGIEGGNIFFADHIFSAGGIVAADVEIHDPVAFGLFPEFKTVVADGESGGEEFPALFHNLRRDEDREGDEGGTLVFPIVNKGAVFHCHIVHFVAEADEVPVSVDHGAVADGQGGAAVGNVKHVSVDIIAHIFKMTVFPGDVFAVGRGSAGGVICSPEIFPPAVADQDIFRTGNIQSAGTNPVAGKEETFHNDIF